MVSNNNDIKKLKPQLDKILEEGKLDSWLRDLAKITPRATDIKRTSMALEPYDFNTHTSHYTITLQPPKITEMTGFNKLMQKSAENNVKVEIHLINKESIEVRFDPTSPFEESVAFGMSYKNIAPIFSLQLQPY